MKVGYRVESDIFDSSIFILVSNYAKQNSVHNWGCDTKEELENLKYNTDIGFWRIKRK